MQGNSRPFTLLIIGDYTKEQLDKYNRNIPVEPYLKYEFKDVDKIFNDKLLIYNSILKSDDAAFTLDLKKRLHQYLQALNQSENPAFEHYKEITLLSGLRVDEKGDAYSTENINAKFTFFEEGLKSIGMPFYKKNDTTDSVYSELKKSEVDWEKIHRKDVDVKYYSRLWDIFMDGQEPTDEEKPIVESLQFMPGIIGKFRDKTKEEYVGFYTSWGCNAVLKDGEWFEVDELEDEFIWFSKFYDKFIKDLPEDVNLLLCECKK